MNDTELSTEFDQQEFVKLVSIQLDSKTCSGVIVVYHLLRLDEPRAEAMAQNL